MNSRCLIIDNVNNLSGAPRIAKAISDALNCDIVCARKENRCFYEEAVFGLRSSSSKTYPIALLALMFKVRFWILFVKSDTIIVNTSLVWPFAVIGWIFRKKLVVVLHENSKKNILYKLGIPISTLLAKIIVTPSRDAYKDIKLDESKWLVVSNTIDPIFFLSPDKEKSRNGTAVLFVDDGREYKGTKLFSSIRAEMERDESVSFFSTKDVSKGPFALTPEVYDQFDLLLVLTDNRYWKETFGLIGCEAASRGVIPLFTDSYAYLEVWSEFRDDLYIENYCSVEVKRKIVGLASNPIKMKKLSNDVREHAQRTCDITRFERSWSSLIKKIESK